MGRWLGTSVWTEQGARKAGQISLGKVISKEKLIFYKSGQGFYQFDPNDQSMHDIALEDLPSYLESPDHRLRDPPVIVSFGADYFLDKLLHDIEYIPVLDTIDYGNPDRLHSMLHYYILSNRSNCHADTWYRHNYVKFLYPKANISSQRISDFMKAVGTRANTRKFLQAHIEYLLGATDHEKCILIDSTGCPDKCSLYVTKWSVHDNKESLEFRVIVVVQKSTGFPLYYEIIRGNVVDIATVMRIIDTMAELGCEVEYVLGDAGYCCPSVMERMIWAGMDFMTRLCPHFNIFKTVVQEHLKELEDPGILIDFNGRMVRVLKLKQVIAHDKKTREPIEGYVYLCRDVQAHCSKVVHLTNSKKFAKMTNEEFQTLYEKLGLFAIVTTRDVDPRNILSEYYIRQAIEQLFDFAKNYGRFLPVRCQNIETLNGHMLLAFMATFVISLVKYRLNLVDTRYAAVRNSVQDAAVVLEDETTTIELENEEQETVIEQNILNEIFRDSAGELFYDLQLQMADVYDSKIIPELIAESSSLYGAYELHSPRYVEIRDGKAVPVLRDGDVDKCSKILAFAKKPVKTDEEIKAQREARKQKQLEKAAAAQGFKLVEKESTNSTPTTTGQTSTPKKSGPDTEGSSTAHRGPGRPKGSKNRKTLEREQQEQAGTTVPTKTESDSGETATPVKRGPGRPKGSKNRKTIERERQAAAAASQK